MDNVQTPHRKTPGIKQRTAPPAALRWSRHEAVINGSGVIRSQQIHVSLEMVIWSGGLIYISQSPSVFIFACKISAWPDIRNAKCHSRRTSSPRGSRAPSQINMQIDDIDFFSGRKMVILSLAVRLTGHQAALTCRREEIKRLKTTLHRRR